MKILILGGTVFLGRHVVEAALARGHELTLFHRGKHGSSLYPEIEHLYGDRRSDLSLLKGREWDAVIDPSGYVPAFVRASAQTLAASVKQYVFISSVSVYADESVIGLDESGVVSTITPEQLAEVENVVPSDEGTVARTYGEWYGALKALCEQAAEEVMPGRVLTIRPGLIVGPYDYSDRFTYWVQRVARGGEVLAPGNPDQRVQYIDVRDLAEWIIRLVETAQTGVYNATGLAEERSTMRQLLQECKAVSGSNATFTWIDEAFLLKEQVQPWSQLPLWLPDDPATAGFMAVNASKAHAAGLTFRSLAEIISATLAWDRTRPVDVKREGGLNAEEEVRLLQLWHEQQNA